jgi:hypothetical protein
MGVRKIVDEPSDPELESAGLESDADRLYPGKSRMVSSQEPYIVWGDSRFEGCTCAGVGSIFTSSIRQGHYQSVSRVGLDML